MEKHDPKEPKDTTGPGGLFCVLTNPVPVVCIHVPTKCCGHATLEDACVAVYDASCYCTGPIHEVEVSNAILDETASKTPNKAEAFQPQPRTNNF